MKKRLYSAIVCALLAISVYGSESLKPNGEMGKIARVDATITASRHYRQHAVDDEISKLLFKEYFKTLDPNKIYFTRNDINRFRSKISQLDDNLNFGRVQFAFDVYNLYLDKVRAYRDFVKEKVKNGFDFKKSENFSIDRTKKEWAKTEAELKDVWRKRIKNDILTYRLMDRAKKEQQKKEQAETDKKKEQKDAKDKKAVHASWNKTPEERLLKRINQQLNYLEKNEPIDVLELYLSSLKKVYDPHSAYMSPSTVEDFNISMKLSLVGIGAVLTSEDGYTKIVRLIPGGPASRGHELKPEDRIIAVAQDNKPPVDIIDMPLSKVVKLIRGNKDTKVHLTILEGSKGINAIPKVITIVRDEVKLKEQEAKGEIKEIDTGNGKKLKIGLIRLPSFYLDFDAAFKNKKDYKSSTRDVKKILKRFNKEGVDGLILDIRSNGGGSLVEAIELTGLFIKSGPVVQIRNQSGKIAKKYDPDEDIFFDKPLIVMTNRFSASASEIFAGAIQDYGRGIIVGDSHTHGKGTVQTIFELTPFLSFLGSSSPAGAIKLTTAKFYRISGSSTQEKGVVPDIVFPSFSDAMKLGEKHLDYALPWDAIDADDYKIYDKKIVKTIPKLRMKSLKRQKENKLFKLLQKDIEIFKRMRDKKVVSLNEQERWNRYQKEKELLEEQKKLMKLDSAEDKEAEKKKKDKKKDIYLDETLNIMKDFIGHLGKGSQKPTMTAN